MGRLCNLKMYECRSTHLHIFQTILLADAPQHIFLAALLHFAGQEEFVQDEICLLEVEDNVQLAHIAIVFVHLLNVSVNNLEGDQFVVGGSTPGDEEERCIATIDHFCV